MSNVTLKSMNENDVEDLYDLWVENDVWPSGDFFAAITTLEGLEDAIGEDSMAAFKVSVGESRALFAVVVKEEPVHIDLFASDGEELTPDVGAATLGALVDWAFSNTKAKNVIKFLKWAFLDLVKWMVFKVFIPFLEAILDAIKQAYEVIKMFMHWLGVNIFMPIFQAVYKTSIVVFDKFIRPVG